MNAALELTGQTFGRLTVLSRSRAKASGRHSTWLCRCDCGRERIVVCYSLKNGNTRSCGCLMREAMSRVGKANKRINSHG